MKVMIQDWCGVCGEKMKPYEHKQEIEITNTSEMYVIIEELLSKGLRIMLIQHDSGNRTVAVDTKTFQQR
jgi:hypothetical protein